jgi:hypothetical protein
MAEQAPPDSGVLAAAEETIATWATGEDVAGDRLIELATVATVTPGALDGPLERVSDIRRRALIRRLRELAAEARPERDAVTELADRVEELADNLTVTPEQERLLLKHLLANGAQREPQLARLTGVPGDGDGDAAERRAIAEWAADAADRGLIERAEPGMSLCRWQITDRGRAALGVRSAR